MVCVLCRVLARSCAACSRKKIKLYNKRRARDLVEAKVPPESHQNVMWLRMIQPKARKQTPLFFSQEYSTNKILWLLRAEFEKTVTCNNCDGECEDGIHTVTHQLTRNRKGVPVPLTPEDISDGLVFCLRLFRGDQEI
jgi:hypothetical protein